MGAAAAWTVIRWATCGCLGVLRQDFYAHGDDGCFGTEFGLHTRKDAAEVPSLELVSIYKTKDAKPSPKSMTNPMG